MRRTLAVLGLLACHLVAQPAASQAIRPDSEPDPYRWLEDVNGERAMTWVRAENGKTATVLEKDAQYERIYREALAMAKASDRIPYASFLGGALYNFWQDSAHVRGIWRRTTLANYRTGANPEWTTVLDLDSLATAEHANWIWQGADCAQPAERRCLLHLSDGGEDATTIREFDLDTRTFVANGFALPRGKQNVAWMGPDTLLVSREWNPGELTASGYPYILKRLVRGQALRDAVEIFRGSKTDVSVSPATLADGTGHRVTFISRGVSFFESEHYIVRAGDVARVGMPLKASVFDMVGGQVIVRLSETWNDGATSIGAGSLASFDAAAAMRNPMQLAPVAVFVPGPRESVSSVSATRDRLVVGIYHNVRGQVFVFSRSPDGTWTHRVLPLPENVSTDVSSSVLTGDEAFVNVAGFLTPSSVWLADAVRGTATQVRSLPAKFDASTSVVEQFEATSKDGTRVPYFVVRPKRMKHDGANPTIINAYGGFELSRTPSYSPNVGKLWLEHGGVYVLANIRGGGEFGPKWHEAGLKIHRQRIYDDFVAVARDLIARKITSPRRLGIQGGSNGGLLMGVQLTQHPELWNAVDIAIPLLDMLRYEQIAAGASWVGEYGSVSIPAERAFLASISPLHNLRANVAYPTPFIWTTTKDDRVGPQHARKFAAKMADLGKPYLFYEVTEGGHGAGANIEERAHTAALEYTYFTRQLMDATPSASSAPPANAQSPTALRDLAHDYYAWRDSLSPVGSSDAGKHLWDNRLADYRPAAIRAQRAHIAQLLARVRAMHSEAWSRDERIDWLLFRSQLTGADVFGRVMQTEESNPQVYVNEVSNGIFSLIKKEYAPRNTRARAATARLRQVSALLALARTNLVRPVRLYAQLASDAARGGDELYTVSLMTIADSLPSAERADLISARDAAITSLHEFAAWLDARQASMPAWQPMGLAKYEVLLHDVLLLPIDAAQVAMIGETELARYRGLESLLKDPTLASPDPARSANIPKDQAAFLAAYESREKEMIDFLRANALVTLPPYLGRFEIRQLPDAFKPTSPGGFMNPPGIYDADPTGFYFIPTYDPKSGNFYIRAAIEDPRPILGHEGIPGHFLQLSIANHLTNEIRRQHADNTFTEGWALYGEEMLLRRGLYAEQSAGQGQVLRLSRYRAARIGVDVNLQTGRWTFDQGVKYFMEAGGLDREAATGEAAGAAASPTQKIGYMVGKWQIMRLLGRYRDQQGAAFRLGEFHDRLISYGSLPVSVIEWMMLGDSTSVDAVLHPSRRAGISHDD